MGLSHRERDLFGPNWSVWTRKLSEKIDLKPDLSKGVVQSNTMSPHFMT